MAVPGSLSCRPPGTESPQKCSRWHLPAAHLARNPRKSVAGSTSYRPPGTVFLRKCARCPIPLPTWHGIPAKAFQVSLPASHLPRNSRKSVSGSTSYRPPVTASLRKCSRWHLPAVHMPRNPCESVPGSLSRRPPATAVPLIMGCRGFSAGQISSL